MLIIYSDLLIIIMEIIEIKIMTLLWEDMETVMVISAMEHYEDIIIMAVIIIITIITIIIIIIIIITMALRE